MTASRDPDRLIRAFLDEGLTELPDRVYDAVRSDIDRTHQRVVIGPWRTPEMNTFAKIAVVAAAVLVVAVVGYNLLPGRSGVGGGGPVASPSPSPTLSPSPVPSPTPAAFPPAGEMAVGRHSMTLEGVPFSFDVPSGWVSNGTFGIDKAAGIGPEGAGFIFWVDAPVGVFSDPCDSVKAPPVGPSPADLAAAVASVPGLDLVSGPTDVTVGGQPAQHVVVTVREDIDCPANDFYLWYAPTADDARYATGTGSTIQTWIIDVGGSIVWIDGETYKGAGPEPGQEIQQIIDSIQFE